MQAVFLSLLEFTVPMAELAGGKEDVHMSNSNPGTKLPKQLSLRCCHAQAHTDIHIFFCPCGQQAPVETWGRQLEAAASSAHQLVLAKCLLVLPQGSAIHPELPGLSQLCINMWMNGKQA